VLLDFFKVTGLGYFYDEFLEQIYLTSFQFIDNEYISLHITVVSRLTNIPLWAT